MCISSNPTPHPPPPHTHTHTHTKKKIKKIPFEQRAPECVLLTIIVYYKIFFNSNWFNLIT